MLYLNLFLRVYNFLEDISVRGKTADVKSDILELRFWPCVSSE